ncbi:MAG: hypothetical protein OQK05_01160 [Pseudopelagicola sp.]|nr:hypothetical protein [Pseudopelagicola sp.]
MLIAKLLHILMAVTGVGFGLAALLTGMAAAGTPPAQNLLLGPLRIRFARISFASLLLLWLSGLWLYGGRYLGAEVPALFWVKIGAVILLTLASGTAQVMLLRAARGGPAPTPATMMRLSKAGATFALAALCLAVLTFST